jgi:hypothetical protein
MLQRVENSKVGRMELFAQTFWIDSLEKANPLPSPFSTIQRVQ